MENVIRLSFVLHNHQPIGNFGHVIEQAYQDSYLPFLNVFERFENLKISLHTSGPLVEWLDDEHSDYLDRLATLVEAGRVEIIGGAFYEPILTMIPSRDRVGQIATYTRWLENRLGGQVQGMWVPERVWEQSLTRDISAAGIKYTVLDDFHFRNAGLRGDQLHGYYLTEDEGELLSIFPGSERLRYLIPFGDPEETVAYLRDIASAHPDAVVVFGDDGEKFGTWPDTKKHVYGNGWLEKFFGALDENRQWLHSITLAEAVEEISPLGKIYLPDASYREMTEWSLPVTQQLEYENLTHEMDSDGRWPRINEFIRGGFWRNFKVKYPETNVMYSRMMMVSRRLDEIESAGHAGDLVESARRELYRAQCNCSYWHGAFGGIYLPHLRNAVYQHLISADNLLDQITSVDDAAIAIVADDFNFDARQEVRLTNRKLDCLIAAAAGGHLYELDIRTICHNLLATLARRPESYHRKVLAGANAPDSEVASIHDRIVFKQEGLDQRLWYDHHARNSLVDHFFDDSATLEAVSRGEADERGDCVAGIYDAKLRRKSGEVQLHLIRDAHVDGASFQISKAVTMLAEQNSLEISYLLENLPQGRAFHFGIEFNFSGLPAGASDRYFHQADGQQLGHLGTQLDLQDAQELGLVDEWLGVDVRFSLDRPSGLWTFPIETVSQSEGGFELVHQSVVVMPHWHVQADATGCWAVTMNLMLDTSLAESRLETEVAVAGS